MDRDFAAFGRTLEWLYDQARHRGETEPNWYFTGGILADAIGEYRTWSMYLERRDWSKADEAADRLDAKIQRAGDEMRGLRRDAALAETADILRRDLNDLRTEVAYQQTQDGPR